MPGGAVSIPIAPLRLEQFDKGMIRALGADRRPIAIAGEEAEFYGVVVGGVCGPEPAKYGGAVPVFFGKGRDVLNPYLLPSFTELLITFQKTEKEFSPSTMYADYPISRELLHWESQSTTSQQSETGQNLIHHAVRGYTILIFARDQQKRNGVTVPFSYLGPVERVSYESERPIKMVWRLRHQMLVDMFENNRRGG